MGHTYIFVLPLTWLLAVASMAVADETTTTTVLSTTTTIETSTTSSTEPSTTSTTVLVTTTSTTLEPTTTSSSTSTTSTTSTSTSSSTSTSTSTTSTTSTSIQVCTCDDLPLMAQTAAKMSSDVRVNADLGVNDQNGVAIFAANARMADGTKVLANRVKLATGAEVWDVYANTIAIAPGASYNDTTSPLPLPLVAPYCNIPDLTCDVDGGDISATGSEFTLRAEDGPFGRVSVGAGATLLLPDNAPYQFCELRIANGGTVIATHQITIDVPGNVIIGNEASLRTSGGSPLILRAEGTKVLLGRAGLVTAAVMAPHAKAKIKTGGVFEGCICAMTVKAAKGASLSCAGDASPSGAFVD